MVGDGNDGQMIFGDLRGLKLPDICLIGEENPEKTSPRKLVPTGDRTRTRCVTGAHATAWPTAVDNWNVFLKFLDGHTQHLLMEIEFSCGRTMRDPIVHKQS